IDLARLQAFRDAATQAVRDGIPWPPLAVALAAWTRGVLLAPHLFAPLVLILVLERARPAAPGQPLISGGLINDFFWYLAQIGIFVTLTGGFFQLLNELYGNHLGFLTLGELARLPGWARVAVA